MLYCGIDEIDVGMTVAASVFHPRRPDIELLSSGVKLDGVLLDRLRTLGVRSLWVEHDFTEDLDARISAAPSPALQSAFHQLRHDFRRAATKTVSAGQVQAYRQIVMELTCELISNRALSGLTEKLMLTTSGGASVFTHSANVAYLSLSVGLELETYVVRQRRAMALDHARDLTSLGIGAMLHDLGKSQLDENAASTHELDWLKVRAEDRQDATYKTHCELGYEMLADTRAPATARQVVLAHHQRWDGQGFPSMAAATRDRKAGPQKGEEIHIFSRIVAAANVLDNLLRGTAWDAPPEAADDTPGSASIVAALSAFRSERFDGWFDPVVRDMVLRRIPPFAVGSRVVLSDGRAAVVVAPSLEQPCRPAVRLLQEGGGTLDLRAHADLSIIQHAGRDVAKHLFTLPDRTALQAQLTGRQVA